MKNKNLIIMFMMISSISNLVEAINENIEKNIANQIISLKKELNDSNNAYINLSTPMYKQSLTLQWLLNYWIPFKIIQGEYTYTSESLLTQSKNLSDVIKSMENLDNLKNLDDIQIEQLITMLIESNINYMQTNPMHKQNLTLEWYLQYFIPYRILQKKYAYNSHIHLEESKKLARLIVNMINFKNKS